MSNKIIVGFLSLLVVLTLVGCSDKEEVNIDLVEPVAVAPIPTYNPSVSFLSENAVYPNSKYPLFELNVNELLILCHYISDRIDTVFDKKVLKPFKNMSISNVFKLLDIHKKVNDNKAVKAVKKVNPVVKVIKGIVNYANPLYWIKKLVVGGTINIAVNKMSLLIIDIVSSETIKVYSKRLFNEENNLLEDMINKEIAEMEELE